MVTRDDVLKIVRRRRYSPMTAEQLADKLEVPTEERDAFFEMIREMELSGDLVEVKQKQLAIPEKLGLVVGLERADAADALATIRRHIHIPMVADIHFDHALALRALASGVEGLRLNPGNIGNADGALPAVHRQFEYGP